MPLFIKNMTFKNKVQELLDAALAERPELFLVDLSINEANKICINLDSDQGVNLQDADAQQSIKVAIEKVDRNYQRMMIGKMGIAIWTVTIIFIEAIVLKYFK